MKLLRLSRHFNRPLRKRVAFSHIEQNVLDALQVLLFEVDGEGENALVTYFLQEFELILVVLDLLVNVDKRALYVYLLGLQFVDALQVLVLEEEAGGSEEAEEDDGV